jgi:4-hydroxythreonine-4-phosphate dehydrogenase
MSGEGTVRGLPVLAITMGDAAGIGPEIIVKALARKEVRAACLPVVIGDIASMKAALPFHPGPEAPELRRIRDPAELRGAGPAVIPVIQPGKPLTGVSPGVLSAEAGRGAVEFIRAAVGLAKEGKAAGIVTAPLNKEAMHRAGFMYPGHTELLAESFGVTGFSLVLSARGIFLFHVTTHLSLHDAIGRITKERVLTQIRLAGTLARVLGRGGEPVAVAGLNPHAGENGLFGREEIERIAPACEEARKLGFTVEGPLPADVLFPRMARGRYRFCIAMYHDQGHAVFKSLYFDEGVNVTVGLPVIRTSVDHGTAFDIAGKGAASEESLVTAILMAAELGPHWGEISRAVNEPA